MNSTAGSRRLLPLFLSSALLAAGAAAQGHGVVPFRGGFSGGGFPVAITEGHATQLGHFTGTTSVVTVTSTGYIGTYIDQAANGDSVFGTFEATLGQMIGPGVFEFTGVGAVTGGTGRFEGATGSFVAQGTTNLITSAVILTFDGTMSSVGSLH